MAKHDVIVIGSGVGGLTAALTCARAGRNVLVLEAAKQLGGFINPFSRNGYSFDTGIHYIGDLAPGQSLHRCFGRLGLLDTLRFRPLSPDGFDRYIFPDYEVSMCRGIDAFQARLERDFPSQRVGLARFFRVLKEVDAVMAAAGRMSGPMDLVRALPHLPPLVKYRNATYASLLADCVSDPQLKAALAGPSGDLGLPPGRASALAMLGLLAHFLTGAHFPVGGTRAVRDAYVNALRSAGATLQANCPVKRIMTEHGSVVGVCTAGGQEHRAPIVISNADAATTITELLDSAVVGPAVRRKAERIVPSLASLCAFVGTDLQPAEHGLTDANVWHYPSIDIDRLYRPVLAGRVADELPFFLTVPTLKDPGGGHAPAGQHTVEVITFAPWQPFERWQAQPALRREAAYMEYKQQLGEQLLSRAEHYLPGLRAHSIVCEFATPVTNRSYVNVPQGAIYGPEHTPEQMFRGRFRTTGPVEGLYLCGSGVYGAGIATCVASGYAAGQLAVRRGVSRTRRLAQRVVTAARSVRP